MSGSSPRIGPPPLAPFGLVLHHDGSWTHEGQPLANPRLRARFDRSVCYLPDQDKFVVQIGRFRGEIEVEEAPFFVRSFDAEGGSVSLSDGSCEDLAVESLRVSALDGALLCRVKHDLRPGGLLARFLHSAHSELLNEVDAEGESLRIGGSARALPDLSS
jgi:hypothetical protein